MAKDAFDSFSPLYGDVATLENLVERLHNENRALMRDLDEMRGSITRLQAGHHELEAQDEMLSDQLDGMHCGVVMVGGYTNHSDLAPGQRHHVFNVERANLMAARTMGANRYMATVLQ
eukprot:s199_g5.t1